MNKSTLTILQVIWLVIGVFCIIAGIHNKVKDSGERFLILMGMGLLAFAMAYLRHRQRKKD